MQLHIRTAAPGDYPAITSIHNDQNEPDFHTSPERLRLFDERSAARDPEFRRLVAEVGGEVVATGDFRSSWAGETVAGRYWTLVHVCEHRRGEGIDARILDRAVSESPRPVREVRTCVREDFVAAAGFIGAEGFEEQFRSWGSHLDLAVFDVARFDSLIDSLERDGVRIVGYPELIADPDLDTKLASLQRELEADVLAFEPIIPRRHADVTDPDTVLGAAVVAVAPDGSYIGVASLVGNPTGKHLGCGFTGVAREHRNRGVATVLVARTAAVAQRLGCTELNAGGGGVDTPMLRVVRKLGFEVEPAWVTFSKQY